MGFWRTFKAFKPWTRLILIALFLSGLLLCAALTATDQNVDIRFGAYDLNRPEFLQPFGHDWLNGHAYIPNILAGLTGFLIGVPVAAVILATFTTEREESVVLASVNDLSRQAWVRFRTSVKELCTEDLLGALENGAPDTYAVHEQLRELYKNYAEVSGKPRFKRGESGGSTAEQYGNFRKSAAQALIDLAVRFDAMNKAGLTRSQLTTRWSAIAGSWSSLDQYIRLRRLEHNLPWFDEDTDRAIATTVSVGSMLKNPIIHFSFRHDTDWGSSTGSMKGVIDSVAADLQLDKKELDKKLTKILSMFDFGQKGVSDYVSQATDAAKALRGLLDLVEAVDESGWPEKFSKPVRTV